MTIGEAIISIEFSDAEKNRLGELLLQEGSLPYQIFTTKIQNLREMSFWNTQHKKFGINGFRVGTLQAKNIVLRKALESLKAERGAENDKVWYPYRLCAYEYVIHDLENLNKLLLAEELEQSEGSLTEQIFRSIQKKLPLYDATVGDVEKLYELWAFDRTPKFKEIFSKSEANLELIKMLIKAENQKVMQEVSKQVSELKTDLSTNLKTLQQGTSVFDARLSDLNEKLDSTVVLLRSEFQNLAAAVVSKKVSEMNESIRKITQKNSAPEEKQQPRYDQEALVKFQTRIDKMSKQIQQHSEILSKSAQVGNAAIDFIATPQKIAISEEQFYSNWIPAATSAGLSKPNHGLMWVLAQVIRRTKVLICEKPQILQAMFGATANYELKVISPSPLWSGESDWKESLQFISSPSAGPRHLIISDFDTALQEAYLAPSLVSWISNPGYNPCNRIILVPSKPGMVSVSSRIFECAGAIDFNASWLAECSKYSEKIATKIKNQTGALTDLVGFNGTANLEFEGHLRQICANNGIFVPPKIAERFVSLYLGLNSDLSNSDSGLIAANVTLKNWIRQLHGENVGKILEETLKHALGGL